MRISDSKLEKTGSAWRLSVEFEAASAAEAERFSRHVMRLGDNVQGRQLYMPQIESGMSAKAQLAEALRFSTSHKSALTSRRLFVVLIAMRTGVITRSATQWRGGSALVQASHHEISKAEVSKAATVLAGVLPHLLDRRTDVEDAVEGLAHWLTENDWQKAYGELRDPRPTARKQQ